MTVEEIKKRIMEFENMMGDYHRHNTGYDGRMSTFLSSLRHEFSTKKHRKIRDQLLEDVKLIFHQVDYEEYTLLRERIYSAYST